MTVSQITTVTVLLSAVPYGIRVSDDTRRSESDHRIGCRPGPGPITARRPRPGPAMLRLTQAQAAATRLVRRRAISATVPQTDSPGSDRAGQCGDGSVCHRAPSPESAAAGPFARHRRASHGAGP
eukprot:361428-Hanusia_phi.AAC.2